VLIDRFADRVPEQRREKFRALQKALAADLKNRLNPRTYRIEYIDNRDLAGNFYYGLHRVSIHSELIYLSEDEPVISVFSIYHVVRIDDEVILAPNIDVFISYTKEDSPIAKELHDDLKHSGLNCFMAEIDVPAGLEWQETIQSALAASKQILVLLTHKSINQPWVLQEIGAAWVLRKPLIPALVNVAPDDLRDPIRRYQARPIETPEQRKALVYELGRVCRSGSDGGGDPASRN
jgi:hypothetical protein